MLSPPVKVTAKVDIVPFAHQPSYYFTRESASILTSIHYYHGIDDFIHGD